MIDQSSTNQLVHGDCVELMAALPDGLVAATVTSPPYDNMRDYGRHDFAFEPIADQLFRITMPGGVLVLVVRDQYVDGAETGSSARQLLYFQQLGFTAHATMIMVSSGQRRPHGVRYVPAHQFAFVLSKGRPRAVNLIQDVPNRHAGAVHRAFFRQRDGSFGRPFSEPRPIRMFGFRTNIWHYNVGRWHTTKDEFAFDHPALMPEAMAEDHIISWSLPNDLVFDPMAGAGTTLKMALMNGRRYLGFEIHQPYVEIAERRLAVAKQRRRQQLEGWLIQSESKAVGQTGPNGNVNDASINNLLHLDFVQYPSIQDGL
jgi:hypothetical protein